MARYIQPYSNLRAYTGSKEEAIVKQVLEWVITENDFPPPGFYNLIINSSNARPGSSFKDARVYLQILAEVEEAVRKRYEDGFPRCGLVHLKDILDVSVLNEFLAEGVMALSKHTDSSQQSFLALLDFLHEQSRHEKAIQKLITTIPRAPTNGSKETNIMVALACHLFSQLVPGKTYEINEYAKQIPKECCCGCNTKIYVGNTSLGSRGTWYGRVDILLNHTVPISVINKLTDSDEEDEDDEPKEKLRKIDNCDLCDEVKATKKKDFVLMDQKVLHQIVAETITNGFAQVNKNRNSLSHFFIPTFGSTSEQITVYLYDPVNDYLLHIKEELDLWDRSEQLNVVTIVLIWLFFNFTIFTQRKLHAVVDLDKSGLHEGLKERLDYYRKAEIGRNIISPTPDAFLWRRVHPTIKTRKNEIGDNT